MLEFLEKFGAQALRIFLDASIFVLLGFIAAGALHAFVPLEIMKRLLGKGRFMPVLKASAIGLPLPLCSCGVLPAAMGLRRMGASRGATVSFLVSTPETGVDSIAISFALLGPIMAVFRPVAAFITALVGGSACEVFVAEEKPAAGDASGIHSCCRKHGAVAGRAFFARLRHGMAFAFGEMMDDLGKWLVVGILIAALIAAIVTERELAKIPGGRPVMMLAMLVVGIPLYMCSTSSTPLAAGLILAGVSPGAALVLLLCGPATNAAGIIVVARELGKKTAAVYLISIAAVSVIMGVILDFIYDHFVQTQPWKTVGQTAESIPEWLRIGGAVALAAFLVWTLVKRFLPSRREDSDSCECGGEKFTSSSPK